MKADDFVQSLRAQAPTRDELLEYGLNDEAIDEIRSAFHVRRRADVLPPHGHESEVEKLLRLYDCSHVEIGLVHMNRQVETHPAGRAIARWEADPIVVLASGEVAAFDHSDPTRRIADVSSDSEGFLAALATLARMVRRKTTWRGRTADAANECAAQAGGERYRAFFQSMCAFLNE